MLKISNRLLEFLVMSEEQQKRYLSWLIDQVWPKDGLHWEPFVERGFVKDIEYFAEATQYDYLQEKAIKAVKRYSEE